MFFDNKQTITLALCTIYGTHTTI